MSHHLNTQVFPLFFWLKVFLSKFVWPPFRKAEAKTQHYLIFRAVGNEGADDLTLFQPGGQIMPTPLLILPPPAISDLTTALLI